MIHPIDQRNLDLSYSFKNKKQNNFNIGNVDLKTSKYSDYQIGQALRAMNKITFRGQAEPVEVTHLYNKKVEGKNHLDLPNIHVYEFPDTNLQVIVDENANMGDESLLEIRLHIGENSNDYQSYLKNQLCKNIVEKTLMEKYPESKIKDSRLGFFTVEATSNENNNRKFQIINDVITNLKFNKQIFKEEKQNLINKIITEQDKYSFYDLLSNDKQKSIKEYLEEIDKIEIFDIENYYKETLKNSEATYYITLNKKHFNKEKMSKLLSSINNGINGKFIKATNNQENYSFVLNEGEAIYINNETISGIEFNYPYLENNFRDCLIGFFTTLLLTFLAEPYIKEDSDIAKDKKLKYHNIKFYMPKPEFTKLSPERALKIQKEIVGMVYDTDFTVTLDDLKQIYKEKFNEEINEKYQYNTNNINLYEYGKEIFHLYEILDSINTNDIKAHMKKYLIEQEPIVEFNTSKETE